MVSQSAWFHFCGHDDSLEAPIRSELAQADILLQPFEACSDQTCGILCFTQVDDVLFAFLHGFRRDGHSRVLALSAMASEIEPALVWRLLHAGASEVLIWDSDRSVVKQIRARLDRWFAVDELLFAAAERESIIGESRVWRIMAREVVEAARYGDNPVLLTGESGTGKEMLARLFHAATRQTSEYRSSSRELVTVDCSTLSSELSGSELFGHERGAFTGAHSSREGAFALANGTTLFLDEIGEMPYALQAQLLRAIQEKVYKRVGGNAWQSTNFRLICATNRNLEDLVREKLFRLDLYYRIAGCVIRMPPLRERREDILPLANYFLNTALPQNTPEFDSSVQAFLLNRTYEGNVRELRQLVQRIAYHHVGPGPITPGDIPESDRPVDGEMRRAWPDEQLARTITDAIALGATLKDITHITTETAIRIAVQSEKGNLQRAAKRLGVTDRALQLRRAAKSHTSV